MAVRAAQAGYQICAHARVGKDRSDLLAAGIELTRDAATAVAGRDFVVVSLFDDRQIVDMFDGKFGLMALLSPGTILVLHTTGSPDKARDLARVRPDITVLDATFSGTAEQAECGDLVLLVGGDAGALARARPLLQSYASQILHVGDVGEGRSLKLLNNSLFAANFRMAADALRIAARMGIDTNGVPDALARCSGGSFALARFAGRPMQEVVEGVKRYLDKDVDAMRQMADLAGIELGLLGQVVEPYGITQAAPSPSPATGLTGRSRRKATK
jgi:3-hydroxyisobutyrate dehydrogenase-like beta-hydroxyacid dehydrogenase